MIKLKSITTSLHDSSYGGYAYKVTVMVNVNADYYKTLKVTRKAQSTMFGHSPASRDLGPLVIDVNNLVYRFNNNIPAYNPSIDSTGTKKAKGGIKTMEFVYFFNDHDKARALGIKFIRDSIAQYGQYISLL